MGLAPERRGAVLGGFSGVHPQLLRTKGEAFGTGHPSLLSAGARAMFMGGLLLDAGIDWLAMSAWAG